MQQLVFPRLTEAVLVEKCPSATVVVLLDGSQNSVAGYLDQGHQDSLETPSDKKAVPQGQPAL